MRYTKVSMSSMSKRLSTNQRGIVSLMVTLIMIFVISLLVIAFAQLTRRNQREALDRQQSSQAYYAAETGVNDAVSYLNQPAHRSSPITTTNCSTFNVSNQSKPPTVDIGGGASYACLKVNNAPMELIKRPLPMDDSLVWPIKTVLPITNLTVKWTVPVGVATSNCGFLSLSALPQFTSWNCDYGMMRIDLYDASAIPTIANMAAATKSYYVFPRNGPSPGVSSGARANLGYAQCASRLCTANIALPPNSGNYYMRMAMLYHDADQVTVIANAGVTPLALSGAQAIIDSTGRSQDQLRRIQVRVSLVGPSSNISGFATQGDICKRITASPVTAYDQGSCTGFNN
jgi:hypothetical protein